MVNGKGGVNKDFGAARRRERINIRREQAEVLRRMGFKVEFVTYGHVRINDRINLFLSNGRWLDTETGDGGRFYRVRDAINAVYPARTLEEVVSAARETSAVAG